MSVKKKLLVLDVDNTLFDWVHYYTQAFEALIQCVASKTGLDEDALYAESKAVFSEHESIEHPFLIQSLPSVLKLYGHDSESLLSDVVAAGRQAFLDAAVLEPYGGVVETLESLLAQQPDLKIAALTDAPRYVAMWKMNKLGLLRFFDAVYGLPDPVLPKHPTTGRILVDPEITKKHFEPTNFHFAGRIRVMPGHFEKPNKDGLQLVLQDYDILANKEEDQVLWVGDNLQKDIQLGKSLHVPTAWASYGAQVPADLLDRLAKFSPPQNIRKNANVESGQETWQADYTLTSFTDLLEIV